MNSVNLNLVKFSLDKLNIEKNSNSGCFATNVVKLSDLCVTT